MISEINKEIKELEARINHLKNQKNNHILNLALSRFKKYGIKLNHLIDRTRKQEIVYLRSMFIYILRMHEMKLVEIAEITGMHYSTVINSLSIIKDLKETKDVKYYNTFKMICLE